MYDYDKNKRSVEFSGVVPILIWLGFCLIRWAGQKCLYNFENFVGSFLCIYAILHFILAT